MGLNGILDPVITAIVYMTVDGKVWQRNVHEVFQIAHTFSGRFQSRRSSRARVQVFQYKHVSHGSQVKTEYPSSQ